MGAADWARGVRLQPDAHSGPERRVASGHGRTQVSPGASRGRRRDLSGLPQTWFGTSWGDVPTWLVPLRQKGDKGRGFVLYRKPHKTAVDPETGEEYDDLAGDPHRQP